MEHKDLQECIRSLAMMDETDSIFISCYLNLEKGAPRLSGFFQGTGVAFGKKPAGRVAEEL